MISIRKQRQIKLIIILSIILILITVLFLIFGYFPYGLHKKDMQKVKMPKDSIAYLSVQSLNKSILKFADSIYAYRISHDEAMYDFSIMIRKVETFAVKLKSNNNFFVKLLYKSIVNRNAAILLWEYNNNLNESEIYYMFDVGKLNAGIFKSFFNSKEFLIDNTKYDVKKINYNGNRIYALNNNDNPFIFFNFYNGLLIITKNYNHIKKLIDFFNSKSDNFNDIELLKNAKNEYYPDISFYINKKLFDYNKCEGSMLFTPLKFFNNVFGIYGNIKFYNENGIADIFANYEYGGSERVSLYNLDGSIDIQNYLSKDKTIMYFGLKSYLSGLYPIIYNELKTKHDNELTLELYNLLTKMNDTYSFGSIINDLYGEIGIAYVESQRSKLIYPIVILNIENDNSLLPKLEIELLKKYPTLNKLERNYNNGYIYSYNLYDEKSLYYTFIDRIYFISENEKAIETIIDNSYDYENLQSYIKKQTSKEFDPDYIFTIQFSKSQDILSYFDVPLRTWSYPNSIIIGSKILSNYTHINLDFKASFRSKINQ